MPIRQDMAVLESAMLVGLGAVALWVYLRFPTLRPSTLTPAIVHVGISFVLFNFLPYGVGLCLRLLPSPLSIGVFVLALLVPVLGYVLVSWVWLIARLLDLHDPTPRGGHRVPADAR
jgi:hypothetical protein